VCIIEVEGSSMVQEAILNPYPDLVLFPSRLLAVDASPTDDVIAVNNPARPFSFGANEFRYNISPSQLIIDAETGSISRLRDVVLEYTDELTDLSILSTSGIVSHMYTAKLAVLDTNNNKPVIDMTSTILKAFENELSPTTLGLVVVTDGDITLGNITLSTTTPYMTVEPITQNAPGVFSFRVWTTQLLDRELSSTFAIQVLIADGEPSHTQTATLAGSVLDRNDNRPSVIAAHPFRCTDSTCLEYRYEAPETTLVDAALGAFQVSDNDDGENARVTVSVETSTSRCDRNAARWIGWRLLNGRLSLWLLEKLDYESQRQHRLCLVLQDGGQPSNRHVLRVVLQVQDVPIEYVPIQASPTSQLLLQPAQRNFVGTQLSVRFESNGEGAEGPTSLEWNVGSPVSQDCQLSGWQVSTPCFSNNGPIVPVSWCVEPSQKVTDGVALYTRVVTHLRDEDGLGRDCERVSETHHLGSWTVDVPPWLDAKMVPGQLYLRRHVQCQLPKCLPGGLLIDSPPILESSVNEHEFKERQILMETGSRNGYLRQDGHLDGWLSGVQNLSQAHNPPKVPSRVMCTELEACLAIQSLVAFSPTLNVWTSSNNSVHYAMYPLQTEQHRLGVWVHKKHISSTSTTIYILALPQLVGGLQCANHTPCGVVTGAALYCRVGNKGSSDRCPMQRLSAQETAAVPFGAEVLKLASLQEGLNTVSIYASYNTRFSPLISSVVQVAVTVDLTPPRLLWTGWPSAFATIETAASFQMASSEALSSVQCSLDGRDIGNCVLSFAQHRYNVTLQGLNHGEHQLVVVGTDLAGLESTPCTATFQVDLRPPDVKFSTLPTGAQTATNAVVRPAPWDLTLVVDEPVSTLECTISTSPLNLSICCMGHSAGCYSSCIQGTLFQSTTITSTQLPQFDASCFESAAAAVRRHVGYMLCVSRLASETGIAIKNWTLCSFSIRLEPRQHGEMTHVLYSARDQLGNALKRPLVASFLSDLQAISLRRLEAIAVQANRIEAATLPPACPAPSRSIVGTALLAGCLLAMSSLGLLGTWLTFNWPVRSLEEEHAAALAQAPEQQNALLQALELIHMSDMSATLDRDSFGGGNNQVDTQESTTELSTFSVHEARNTRWSIQDVIGDSDDSDGSHDFDTAYI
jgi:hypothetical protein